MLAITLGIATFGTVRSSIWEGTAQLPRRYAGAVGVYLTAVHLRLYIAHGRTRRTFARQAPIVIAAVVVILVALVTLGYAIEQLVCGLGDWPQTLTSSPDPSIDPASRSDAPGVAALRVGSPGRVSASPRRPRR